jgi:hypothetical protein
MTAPASDLDTIGPRANRLAATIPSVPAGLPPGVRITLIADYRRAEAAAELAGVYAAGTLSWKAGYPHLATEADPQAAAAEHAIAEAEDAIDHLAVALGAALRICSRASGVTVH